MRLGIRPLPPGPAFDVVAFGENSLDVVATLTGPVAAGAKLPLSGLTWLPGGQAATAAVASARLGARTRYAGVVGSDEAGDRVAAALAAEGVQTDLVRRDGVSTRTAVILVDAASGQRTVLEHREGRLSLGPEEWPVEAATSGRVLILDATDPPAAVAVARAARAARIPVILDADRWSAGLDELLGLSDVLAVPEAFALDLAGSAGVGEALRSIAARFHSAVAIVTLGANGALALAGGREFHAEGIPIEVRDTTGAGDAFRGGLAAGWIELGPDVELQALLGYANAVAALNCRAVGAQTALPTRPELACFL
jgi:sugar/nucleoside kinase (ribokinase family)